MVLRQVTDLRAELARIESALGTLEVERGKIHAEQARIRQNLESLGDRPTEKELRERFVRTLNSQEDRLEQIDREVTEKIKARDQAREKIAGVLAKLEYEADV